MIAVPEATELPIDLRPMRASNSAISAAGNPDGKVGNGRSSTMPINSQCPVTESFPFDRSAIRPYAAVGAAAGGTPFSAASRDRPIAARRGMVSGTCAAMLPSVLLPWSSYSAASGNSPMPTLSRTMTMARENTRLCFLRLRRSVRDGATRNSSGRFAACESSRSRA